VSGFGTAAGTLDVKSTCDFEFNVILLQVLRVSQAANSLYLLATTVGYRFALSRIGLSWHWAAELRLKLLP